MSAENLIVGEYSVIVHRSASDKLAVDSLVLLVWGLSLIPVKERERVPGKVSNQRFVYSCLETLQVFMYTQFYAPYNFIGA